MINEPFRPVRGIGVAASVLIGLDAVLSIADAINSQRTANVVQEYADGNATMQDLESADAWTLLLSVPMMVITIAAGVTFVVWLYRSRRNAERVTNASEHRRLRPWAIWGWVVPIVNFWYPLQVVQDVWRSFDPAQQDRPLQARDNNGFLGAWWAAYLLMLLGDQVVTFLLRGDAEPDVVATWSWVSTVPTIAAAALAIVLVKRLTDLQDQTRPAQFSGPVQVHVPGA